MLAKLLGSGISDIGLDTARKPNKSIASSSPRLEAKTMHRLPVTAADYAVLEDELQHRTRVERPQCLILRAAPWLGATTHHGFVAIAQNSFDLSTICACAKPAAASDSATPCFG